MKKIFLTLMSCVVALAAYATVMEFDIDESSFIANDNTSSLTTANVTFSNGVARIEGNTSASNKRLHTNHLTLAAGKYSLSAWVKAESAAAKARIGWTNPNPSDASKTVFNYDANPTTLSQGADYVEISMEFELSASTDMTLFVSNNGKTGNAILLNRLVLSSDGNSGTDPVTPPTGCTESGSCGDNLQWCYNSSTHTLTITGTGSMTDWDYSPSPWYSYRSEIKTVNLPDGLTSIGYAAFSGCTGLTSVTIPNSVTSIGYYAFSGCSSVTSINIPNSVTSIGNSTFYGCSSLTSVTIPNSVTSIGEGAFEGCSGLTSITIPNSVTSIDTSAFEGCSGLTSITIPNSVTSIGAGAFEDCTGLTSINIPNSVTSIGNSTFYGCSSLTSVTIPNSVTSIGYYAFEGCSGLTSVTIGNSVTSIGNRAFYECTGLTSITIGNSVTSIGTSAFYGCSGLTSITIPNSVTSIGSYAFSGCTSLTSINIPNSVTSIGECAFEGCRGLTSVTIPNSVTSIGEYAFYGCSGLTSVTIPESVTSIGTSAFYWCTSLQYIVYGGSATGSPWGASCGVYAAKDGYLLFSDAAKTNLVKCLPEATGLITLPESVTSIGSSAFSGCTGLTSVTIPESVKTIGDKAFENCTGLENLYCYRSMPPNAYSTAFDGVDKFSCVLHVPSASIDFYKNATAWRDFYYTTILGAETATTAVTSLEIIPHEDNADVMWPVVADAMTYEFTITHDGAVVCTLKFNSEGQLMGIILNSVRAPAQNANHAPSNGFWFNVTGLENGSEYTLTILAKNSAGNVVRTFTQNFTTGATAIDEVNADGVALKPRKVLEEGRVIILMPDGRKFDASGRQIK